jgi:hypothetical protein
MSQVMGKNATTGKNFCWQCHKKIPKRYQDDHANYHWAKRLRELGKNPKKEARIG